jgi:hypothetical protein
LAACRVTAPGAQPTWRITLYKLGQDVFEPVAELLVAIVCIALFLGGLARRLVVKGSANWEKMKKSQLLHFAT